ncbi:nuclear pore complex protein NUP43 isoform X2 [Silene latifolia]|uniref:nuclear pore complex protein NUP43 isoform X2 n=1 Tax=Silene latifolia TaxID=37657 RepID=UPI003D76D658
MAIFQHQPQNNIEIHHIPQSKYVDGVRWLPSLSAVNKTAVLSLYGPSTATSTVEVHSFDPLNYPILSPLSSYPSPSRITSLKTTPTLIAFSTLSGGLTFLSPDCSNPVSVSEIGFHSGTVSGIDVLEGGEGECCCVSVGEDGRVNLVNVGGGKVEYRRVFDGDGLVGYNAVKWASSMEFVTSGLGFSLQWWDQRRKSGEPVLQFKPHWPQTTTLGMVHSIDIHPSRKHTCVAGGSSGAIFGWDLRWPQQPIILSGAGDRAVPSISESEVWEVQFDCHMQSSNVNSMSSSKILPVMMCSEDGILAVLEAGGAEPTELLEEHCAINCLDIDKQNHSDIICGLEWESVAVILRS